MRLASCLLLLVVARCLLLVHSIYLCYFFESRAWALVEVCILAVWSVIEIRIQASCMRVIETRYSDCLVCNHLYWTRSETKVLWMTLWLSTCCQMHLILLHKVRLANFLVDTLNIAGRRTYWWVIFATKICICLKIWLKIISIWKNL